MNLPRCFRLPYNSGFFVSSALCLLGCCGCSSCCSCFCSSSCCALCLLLGPAPSPASFPFAFALLLPIVVVLGITVTVTIPTAASVSPQPTPPRRRRQLTRVRAILLRNLGPRRCTCPGGRGCCDLHIHLVGSWGPRRRASRREIGHAYWWPLWCIKIEWRVLACSATLAAVQAEDEG